MAQGPQDNPDFIRLPQVVPFIVRAPSTVALPDAAVHTVGPVYVGNLPTIYVSLQSFLNAQLVQLIVQYSNDSTIFGALSQYTLKCDNTHRCMAAIPVWGNFASFFLSATAGGAGNLSADYFVNGVGAGVKSNALFDGAGVLTRTNAALGAGATDTTDLGVTTPGVWEASVLASQPGPVLIVQQQLANGVWTVVRQSSLHTADTGSFPVALVAAPTRVQVINTAGVAATVVYSLAPQT